MIPCKVAPGQMDTRVLFVHGGGRFAYSFRLWGARRQQVRGEGGAIEQQIGTVATGPADGVGS